MRGEILYFDNGRGTGFISGDDGNRYVFDVSDLESASPVAKGTKVAFEADEDRARQINPLVGSRPNAPIAGEQEALQALSGGADETSLAEPVVVPGLLSYFRYCVTTGYVRFRGRARRREYWSFAVISLIGFAIVGGIGFAVGTALGFNEAEEPTISVIALFVFWLFLLLPSLAVLIRRLHDIGLSGWFLLLGLVPTFGQLIVLVFTLIGSQKHENKWGPVPTGVHV